ncbi:hypothetical protein D3C73_1207870 [compost metagenome]
MGIALLLGVNAGLHMVGQLTPHGLDIGSRSDLPLVLAAAFGHRAPQMIKLGNHALNFNKRLIEKFRPSVCNVPSIGRNNRLGCPVQLLNLKLLIELDFNIFPDFLVLSIKEDTDSQNEYSGYSDDSSSPKGDSRGEALLSFKKHGAIPPASVSEAALPQHQANGGG